ncbi:glycosyltransferase family 4 protein [Agrobacterium rosae]
MMTTGQSETTRVLMTVDAVGGVWRYAMDLAAGLRPLDVDVVFVGLGPQPSDAQRGEAETLGMLRWLDAPLDWMVQEEEALAQVGPALEEVATSEDVHLLHLNLPSQAAMLATDLPVVAMSHSCVVTWFAGVRGQDVPPDWQWHRRLNRQGFDRANAVLAPSRSHATMLKHAYGAISNLTVIYNATRAEPNADDKDALVVAAGRWWDEGKNGHVLDEAAKSVHGTIIMAGANRGPQGQYLPIRHADHRGELKHDEVAALMRHSSIFVSPSVYEPFGLAALEAARAANAMVLADIPTYRELWHDAALFVDPQKAAAFAFAINRLWDDEPLRRQLAEKATQRSRNFEIDRQAAAVADLYNGLLRRSSSFRHMERS